MPLIITSAILATAGTLAALRNEVISDSFDSVKYTPLVNQWLNEAQGRIARRMGIANTEASTTLSITPGVSSYALPADLIILTAVEDDRGELEPIARDDLPVRVANAKPTQYALYGSTLLLYPTPVSAATFTLRYRKTIADMVVDTDVPGVPEDFHHILVSYALYKAYRKEDDMQMAAFYWQEFERDLRDMRASVQYRDSSRRRLIGGKRHTGPRFHRP